MASALLRKPPLPPSMQRSAAPQQQQRQQQQQQQQGHAQPGLQFLRSPSNQLSSLGAHGAGQTAVSAITDLKRSADTFALQEAKASHRLQDLASKLEMSERVRSEVAARLKEEEARVSHLEARVKEEKKQFSDTTCKLDVLFASQSLLEREFMDAKSCLQKAAQNEAALNDKWKEQDRDVQELQLKFSTMDDDRKRLEEELAAALAKLAVASAASDGKDAEIAGMKQEIQDKAAEAEKAQEHVAELSDEIKAATAALADATKKSEELATSHERASDELKQATDNAAKVKTELDAALASLEGERAKIKEADEVLSQLRATKDELDQHLAATKGAHSKTTKELESARNAASAMEAKLTAHQEESMRLAAELTESKQATHNLEVNYAEDMKRLESDCDKAKGAASKTEGDLRRLGEMHRDLKAASEKQTKEHTAAVTALDKEVQELKQQAADKASELGPELAKAASELADLRQKLTDALAAAAKEQGAEKERHEQECQRLNRLLDATEKQHSAAERERNNAKAAIDKLTNDIAVMQQKRSNELATVKETQAAADLAACAKSKDLRDEELAAQRAELEATFQVEREALQVDVSTRDQALAERKGREAELEAEAASLKAEAVSLKAEAIAAKGEADTSKAEIAAAKAQAAAATQEAADAKAKAAAAIKGQAESDAAAKEHAESAAAAMKQAEAAAKALEAATAKEQAVAAAAAREESAADAATAAEQQAAAAAAAAERQAAAAAAKEAADWDKMAELDDDAHVPSRLQQHTRRVEPERAAPRALLQKRLPDSPIDFEVETQVDKKPRAEPKQHNHGKPGAAAPVPASQQLFGAISADSDAEGDAFALLHTHGKTRPPPLAAASQPDSILGFSAPMHSQHSQPAASTKGTASRKAPAAPLATKGSAARGSGRSSGPAVAKAPGKSSMPLAAPALSGKPSSRLDMMRAQPSASTGSKMPLPGVHATATRTVSNARRGSKLPAGSKNSRAAANKLKTLSAMSPAPSGGKTDCSILGLGDIFSF